MGIRPFSDTLRQIRYGELHRTLREIAAMRPGAASPKLRRAVEIARVARWAGTNKASGPEGTENA